MSRRFQFSLRAVVAACFLAQSTPAPRLDSIHPAKVAHAASARKASPREKLKETLDKADVPVFQGLRRR
jgi:hypothetical protein